MTRSCSKTWDSADDIDFVKLLNGGAPWAVIAPHPDDELIMAYSFMRSWPKSGRIIIVTNGEAGIESGFESLDGPSLVSTRYEESLRVATQLGMDMDQVVFLGNKDGGANDDPNKNWNSSIIGAINAYAPDIILAPHPLELHPDHQKVGKIVSEASGSFLKLFTCWPRGLSIGRATYELRLHKSEWSHKQKTAKTYLSQPFVSERLVDPFYSVERFWTKEQLPQVESSVDDSFAVVHSLTSFALNSQFRYLSDNSTAKKERVTRAIQSKVDILGTDPWNFKSSKAEIVRINCTVSIIQALEPKSIVECGCANGEILKTLSDKGVKGLIGIESNTDMAKEAKISLKNNAKIITGDFLQELSSIPVLDVLVITELCYYIHPIEWSDFCSMKATLANKIVFSMRPADKATAYITPLLVQEFRVIDANIVCRDNEAIEDGWIVLSMEKK